MEDKILETVVNGIDFEIIRDILVKPLGPVMIKKTITEPVKTGEKDENGYEIIDNKEVTKEVESEFEKGIILALPFLNGIDTSGVHPYEVGDIVAYHRKYARDYDLFKDSKLLKPYDIISKYKK